MRPRNARSCGSFAVNPRVCVRARARVRRDEMSFVSDYYCEVRKIRRLGARVSRVHLCRVDWNWWLRIDRESMRSSSDTMFLLEYCCRWCCGKFSAS